MKQILVIEQVASGSGVGNHLECAGFSVQVVRGLAAAEIALATPFPDFVIVNDVGSGGLGLAIVMTIRSQSSSQIQIMLVTGTAENDDRVAWLRAGVDDYITEPYSANELIARVRARMQFLRCTGPLHLESRIPDNIEFVPSCLQVRLRNVAIQLTRREYALLARLHLSRGKVVSRPDLFRDVFGYKSVVKSRAIDVHVARLRNLLGDNGKHHHRILTVRNCGYQFDCSHS